jgi:hypothetical protein
LREALEIEKRSHHTNGIPKTTIEALAIPSDTSALDALMKDAARYCYLRANPDFQIEYTGKLTLDEHVDAAIAGEAGASLNEVKE